jgi:hypothetical protein
MTDNVVTCAFCGKQYPTGTPVTKHALLTEHIFQCEKHPIQEIGKVLAEFMSLSWPPNSKEIAELRSGLIMMGVQMPDHEDVIKGINGLNQLEKFLPKEPK